jgi:hypothetical protein
MRFWVKEGKSDSKLVSVVWWLCLSALKYLVLEAHSSESPIPADMLSRLTAAAAANGSVAQPPPGIR